MWSLCFGMLIPNVLNIIYCCKPMINWVQGLLGTRDKEGQRKLNIITDILWQISDIFYKIWRLICDIISTKTNVLQFFIMELYHQWMLPPAHSDLIIDPIILWDGIFYVNIQMKIYPESAILSLRENKFLLNSLCVWNSNRIEFVF